jgi:hypothetical protein
VSTLLLYHEAGYAQIADCLKRIMSAEENIYDTSYLPTEGEVSYGPVAEQPEFLEEA